MINFIKNHFGKEHIVALALLGVAIAGLIALNAYVLEMTRGNYNIIDILF